MEFDINTSRLERVFSTIHSDHRYLSFLKKSNFASPLFLFFPVFLQELMDLWMITTSGGDAWMRIKWLPIEINWRKGVPGLGWKGSGEKGGAYSWVRFTKIFSNLFKDGTKSSTFFTCGTEWRRVSPPNHSLLIVFSRSSFRASYRSSSVTCSLKTWGNKRRG